MKHSIALFVFVLSFVFTFAGQAQAYTPSTKEYKTDGLNYNPRVSVEANCRTTFANFASRHGLQLRNVVLNRVLAPDYMTIASLVSNGQTCSMNCARGYLDSVYCGYR